MTEAQEIAATLRPNPSFIRSMRDAEKLVDVKVGLPADLGHQVHANIAEAVLAEANAARSLGGPGFERQAEDPAPFR